MTSGCTKHVLGCTKAVACFAEYGCLKSWRCNLITPEESSWGSFSWASLMHWLLRLKSCYLHGTMCSFFRRERERVSRKSLPSLPTPVQQIHQIHCTARCISLPSTLSGRKDRNAPELVVRFTTPRSLRRNIERPALKNREPHWAPHQVAFGSWRKASKSGFTGFSLGRNGWGTNLAFYRACQNPQQLRVHQRDSESMMIDMTCTHIFLMEVLHMLEKQTYKRASLHIWVDTW